MIPVVGCGRSPCFDVLSWACWAILQFLPKGLLDLSLPTSDGTVVGRVVGWAVERQARWKFGSLREIIEHLRPILIGWRGYYKFTEIPGQLTELAGWTRRRLRYLVWRHWKTTNKRFKELVQRGVNPRQARPVAGSSKGPWSLSTNGAIHKALPNRLSERLGFPSLCVQ